MPTYTQAGRLMAVTTPLGPNALLLETLTGTEELSALFTFRLGVLAPPETQFTFDQLLGQSVTIALSMPGNTFRFLNGIVVSLSEEGQVHGPRGTTAFVRYRAEVVPKIWLLTRRMQSRIFQQIKVPDILKKVFTGFEVDWAGLQGTYEPRDYCVQYRESDFDFASRIMEEEGIYYYFSHADGSHKMMVADKPKGHLPVPGPTIIRYEPAIGGGREDDRIYSWYKTQEIRSGKVTLWDHCFELPHQHLDASQPIQSTVTVGGVSHKSTVGGNDQLELYDYPGAYAQRFDGIAPGGGDRKSDVQKIFQDNKRTTAIRMEQEAAQGIVIIGASNCRQLAAGHKFTLAEHFNGNGDYVITRVEHDINLIGSYTNDESDRIDYRNDFHCLPFALPYRPAQTTPKAHVWGTQTATVVGPPGEEIFTDKYSRVKVKFHWDRAEGKDANSSCWIRVATLWAGKQWGMIHIPRIGQEVIVAFEEGDPDRPIIVGSVFNAEQMPPETLPADKTISGWKSRSSLEGDETMYNQLMFEDKKGLEYIYFHAQKDFYRVVENNDFVTIGFDAKDKGNQMVTIHNIQQVVVGDDGGGDKPEDGSQLVYVWNNHEFVVGNGEGDCKDGSELGSIWNNQEIEIGKGKGKAKDGSQIVSIFNNQTLIVGSGKGANKDGSQLVTIWKDRQVTIKTGDDKLTIDKGNRETKISMGNDKLTVAMGNIVTKVSLGSSKEEAMQSIELKVGANSIKIDQSGITLKGIMVKIEGTAMAQMKAPMTQVNGDGMLMCKGGIVMIN